MQRSGRAITWMADDFDTNVMRLLDVMSAFSAIRAIGIELFDVKALGARLRNHGCGSISVLHARGRHRDCDEQAHRIDDEITFSPLGLLDRSNPLSLPCGE